MFCLVSLLHVRSGPLCCDKFAHIRWLNVLKLWYKSLRASSSILYIGVALHFQQTVNVCADVAEMFPNVHAKQQFIICSEPDQMMRSVMRFIFLVVALYSSYGF